jgi:hypothetical protein
MQKVLGIGGLFFRSENPEQLAKWYETHLGISVVPTSYEQEPWQQEAGPMAFAPFRRAIRTALSLGCMIRRATRSSSGSSNSLSEP